MSDIRSPNRRILESVAQELEALLPEVVFIGGQVGELLISDPAAVRIRATTDVDVIVSATSKLEFRNLEMRLVSLGFRNDQSEGAPICRWLSGAGHKVDVLPVHESVLGFSNQWYAAVVERAEDFREYLAEMARTCVKESQFDYALQGALPDVLIISGLLEEIRTRFEKISTLL